MMVTISIRIILALTSFPNIAISLCPGAIFSGSSPMTTPEFISFSGSDRFHLVQLSMETSTATDVSVSANLHRFGQCL